MSYEKGDMFILEIAEVFKSEDKTLYRAKNFASLVFDENGLQKLRRIRETAEEAYRRGYELGCEDMRKGNEDQFALWRAAGAEEAWEFVLATDEWDEDIRCYDTYAEAKAEFEKCKAVQKWEPKVGDVVSRCGEKGILLEIIGDSAYVMWTNEGCGYCALKDMSPTGEHVDLSPILEVLK